MLDIENCLIVVIDVQEKLNLAVNLYVENVLKITKASSLLEIPVIVTEQYPKGLGSTVNEIKQSVKNALYVEKTSFSAYLNEDFVKCLQNFNRKQIIIFGIETHICVYQTICDLIKHGYEVYFVKDASASRNNEEANVATELIKKSGAFVTSTEIVLFELIKTSRHPKFKEIQNLIK